MYKKISCLLLCLLVGLGVCGCKKDENPKSTPSNGTFKFDTAKEYHENMDGIFDEKSIVLTFPVLSDIHIEGGYAYESSYNKFVKAMSVLYEKAATKQLDLVCVAGDLVCATNSLTNVYAGSDKFPGTKEEQYPLQSKKERENLLRCVTDTIYNKGTKFFYCYGNHDSARDKYTAEFMKSLSGENNQYYDYFFGGDLDLEGLKYGNRHIKVNGYSFLSLALSANADDFAWLKAKLDSIVAENPAQTIFLLSHYKPNNMTYDSNVGYSNSDKTLKDLLENYPQVITFGGHTHTFVQLENAIMQSEKGFISVDCGALQELNQNVLGRENLVAVNTSTTDIKNRFTSLLVEVDKNGNVRISRYDFVDGEKVGNDWVIPAVKTDGTRALNYTAERGKKALKPEFSSDNLTAELSGNTVSIMVPRALSDEVIMRYAVTLSEKNGDKLKTVYLSSLFYKYTKFTMPDFYECSINIDDFSLDKEYTVSVTAYDSWRNKTETLSATVE